MAIHFEKKNQKMASRLFCKILKNSRPQSSLFRVYTAPPVTPHKFPTVFQYNVISAPRCYSFKPTFTLLTSAGNDKPSVVVKSENTEGGEPQELVGKGTGDTVATEKGARAVEEKKDNAIVTRKDGFGNREITGPELYPEWIKKKYPGASNRKVKALVKKMRGDGPLAKVFRVARSDLISYVTELPFLGVLKAVYRLSRDWATGKLGDKYVESEDKFLVAIVMPKLNPELPINVTLTINNELLLEGTNIESGLRSYASYQLPQYINFEKADHESTYIRGEVVILFTNCHHRKERKFQV